MKDLMRGVWLPIVVQSALVLVCAAPVGADGVAGLVPSEGGLVPATEAVPRVLGYSDVDKLNDGTGGWGTNYWDDLNDDGDHDPGEPFADSADAGWGNPKSGGDSSCWLASACNLLKQLGKVDDAMALYHQYALNGVVDPTDNSILTWDEGGLHEYFIQDWMDQNPGGAADMSMNVHWRSSTVGYTDGMFAWEDWNPRSGVDNYLAAGWEVGIGMWPLYNDGQTGWHEGGHALTMQEVHDNDTFDCTDSDRDQGGEDLNTYNDATRGPTAYEGHDYYAWYNDFYDGDIMVYPVGDVGYICAVGIIPEPATLSLLGVAGVTLFVGRLTRRRLKK